MTTRSRDPGPAGDSAEPLVGVFALQGDHAHHRSALERAGVATTLVRRARDLEGLSGLVLPGGESTTMLNLLRVTGFEQPLRDFLRRREVPVLATCAGLILLARSVTGPEQRSFGVVDCEVARNGYGRQVHSGTFDLDWAPDVLRGEEVGEARSGVFIRAPRIVAVGPGVEVLARRGNDPALVRSGTILGCVFHPELVPDHPVTRMFVESLSGAAGRRAASSSSVREAVAAAGTPTQ